MNWLYLVHPHPDGRGDGTARTTSRSVADALIHLAGYQEVEKAEYEKARDTRAKAEREQEGK